MRIATFFSVTVFASACTETVEPPQGPANLPADPMGYTARELLAAPEEFEGRDVTVVDVVHPAFLVSARACFDEVTGEPVRHCNIAFARFELRDGEAALQLVAAEDFHAPGEAPGSSARMTSDGLGGSTAFGCGGDDVELWCVPTVPDAILSLDGRLEGDVFAVSSVEIDFSITASTAALHTGETVQLLVQP